MWDAQDRIRARVNQDFRGALLGEFRLPIRPESAAPARRFLNATCLAWGVPDVASTTELLGCELVTNTVRHAVTMPGSTVRMLVIRDRERLRVEVHDPSTAAPADRDPSLDDVTGRGLMIVRALAADVGWHPTAHGKAVWFELRPAWP